MLINTFPVVGVEDIERVNFGREVRLLM